MTTRKLIGLFALVLLACSAATIQARDTQEREEVQEFSIEEVLSGKNAKERLSGQIKFYFAKQAYPEPEQAHGTFQTNKQTNIFRKSEEEACQSAFLSAMIALEDRAQREGGNAVVDIKSNYDNNLTESKTTFKCGAGKVMAGVVLQGRVVSLPE